MRLDFRRNFLLSALPEALPELDIGGDRIGFVIAGVPVVIRSFSSEVLDYVRRYFAAYRTDAVGGLEVRIERRFGPEMWDDPDPEFDLRGDRVVQRDFVARRYGRRAWALIGPSVEDGLHNLLRWLLPEALLQNASALVHGAAAVVGGKGYVFFGQSGAGKSTTIHWLGKADDSALVIGDDAVILSLEKGRVYLHSAPMGCGYSREAPVPVRAEVAGLFSLVKSKDLARERMAAAEAAAALLASMMCVGFDDHVEARMDLALGMACALPGVESLKLRKGPDFWNLIVPGRARANESQVRR